MNVTVYVLGIILQGIAGLLALWQVPRAPRRLPWLLVALSSLLIVARRWATLGQVTRAHQGLAPAEVLTLGISLLFFLGVLLMTRMWREAEADRRELRLSREQLAAALQGAREGLWDWELGTDRVTYSPGWKAMLGYGEHELEPRLGTWEALVHPEDRERARAETRAYLEGRSEVLDVEMRMRHKDGRWIHIRSRGTFLPGPDGRPARLVGTHLDVTQQRQAEQALARSEALLRATQHLTRAGGWAWEVATGTMVWTDEMYLIHDLDPGSFTEGDPGHITCSLDCYDPRDRPVIQEAFRRCAEEGIPYDLEFPFTTAKGRRLWIRTMGQAVREEGRVVKVMGNVVDLTELHEALRAREELATARHRAEKAESLARMAGAIAHHFNNRLQTITSNLELLRLSPGSAEAPRRVSAALEAARRAADVNRQMLIYLGHAAGERRPLDLAALLNGQRKALLEVLPPGLALEVRAEEPGPVVRGDEVLLRQLLVNLVTNAGEAMGEGTVRVSLGLIPASDLPARRRPLHWRPEDVWHACLEVADTGDGIAPADLERLFDPFYSTRFTGRGLGLPVVLGIARAHGGGVAVESEPGRGSRFRVFLPVTQEAVTVAPAAHPVTPKGSAVLVVDDDPLLLATAAILVRDHLGRPVFTAGDGAEALAVFQAHRGEIGCVLTDLTMPRMDGWQLLAALRRLEPGLPVVLASGYDQSRVMAGRGEERPQAFLGKPYDLEQLRGALEAAFGPGGHT